MDFPEHLDDEDMQLFKKELRLAGYTTYESAPRWKAMGYSHYLDVVEGPSKEYDVSPVAKYIQKPDGWERLK